MRTTTGHGKDFIKLNVAKPSAFRPNFRVFTQQVSRQVKTGDILVMNNQAGIVLELIRIELRDQTDRRVTYLANGDGADPEILDTPG